MSESAQAGVVLTLRHSLVLFLARAIALPSFTKTQPTGTSSFASASSAWTLSLGFFEYCPPHHDQRLAHPRQIDRGLVFLWDISLRTSDRKFQAE